MHIGLLNAISLTLELKIGVLIGLFSHTAFSVQPHDAKGSVWACVLAPQVLSLPDGKGTIFNFAFLAIHSLGKACSHAVSRCETRRQQSVSQAVSGTSGVQEFVMARGTCSPRSTSMVHGRGVEMVGRSHDCGLATSHARKTFEGRRRPV